MAAKETLDKKDIEAALVAPLPTRQKTISDGGGLYLVVSRSSGKQNSASWVFSYSAPKSFVNERGAAKGAGTEREMGLGRYPAVTLLSARKIAQDARALWKTGEDPLTKRESERALVAPPVRTKPTFKECAEQYIAGKAAGRSNPKHAKQWKATLDKYAIPILGDMAVDGPPAPLVGPKGWRKLAGSRVTTSPQRLPEFRNWVTRAKALRDAAAT